MWKAAVIVFVLLHTDMEVTGDLEMETEMSKPENKEQTGAIVPSDAASSAYSGKLLVVPMDGSHWITMKAISAEMGRRGHQVTVVIPEISVRLGPGKHYDTVTYPVPYDQTYIDSFTSMHKEIFKKHSLMEKMKKGYSRIQKVVGMIHTTAESLLFNSSLISHLEKQGFDAVLTDPMVPTGSLIARRLGIPTVNLLRGIPCSLDMKSAGCPSPPSYVPRFFTGYADSMDFKQRLVNTMVALLEPLFCRLLYWRFDQIAYEFLGEEVGIAEVLSDSDIWLLRLDFTLEFPRPLMPNVVLVGGINCNVRAPLPEHLESWVSGEHGFVVFALGTMVSELPEETSSIFLEAFRQIPQKVIWRYTGQVPDNVPDNVKIMSWVPQNDLLAHPGARAFITHAGSHSLYEGLCHAVPMVMLPIAGDQPDNAKRFAIRGAGVELDIFSVTTEILLQRLNEVINDIRYKDNIQKLSALHKDRQTEPLDLALYWTEYVMKHKGAKHLKSASHRLNWIQYFCLDVIVFLATIALVLGILTAKCMKLCFRKLSRKTKQE